MDPAFGDIAALRHTVDHFLSVHAEMEQVQSEFSSAVHATLAQLASLPSSSPTRSCPRAALTHYTRAFAAGGRYLSLGRLLEARFREIRRSDDLGEAPGLTPDYRWKVKRARELYADLLRDYREMRVAFYDQLGAEMRHAGCKMRGPGPAPKRPLVDDPRQAARSSDPSNPADWELEEPAADVLVAPEKDLASLPRQAKGPLPVSPASPAIWIEIDNSHCTQPSQLSIDGVSLGSLPAKKKTSVRTRAGPREICVMPASDRRVCGDAGTLRRAYLYEGWTLVVRCN